MQQSLIAYLSKPLFRLNYLSFAITFAWPPASTFAADNDSAVDQLPAITITAIKDQLAYQQISRKQQVGILGDKDVMETPFNTVSYTSDYIAKQQNSQMNEIIGATDPSVKAESSPYNFYDGTKIRGFSVQTMALMVYMV